MHRISRQLLICLAAYCILPCSLVGQVPDTVIHAVSPPPTGRQTDSDMGNSVAMDGDLVVVAASEEAVVRIYHATTGVLLHTLRGPNSQSGFGFRVAISGTRVVVSAPRDASGLAGDGSVYVYDLASAAPNMPAVVLHNPGSGVNDSDPFDEFDTSDYFGQALAISGSLVVVGALGADVGPVGYFAGAAYVYDLAGVSPAVPSLTLLNPNPETSYHFGTAVAISGGRVAVGTPFDRIMTFEFDEVDAGTVRIYDTTSPSPTVPAIVLSETSLGGSGYGSALAVSGSRLVVGAVGHSTAFVYDLAPSSPSQCVARLEDPGLGSGLLFGSSLAISGTRVVVGAPPDFEGGPKGFAFVFDLAAIDPALPMATLSESLPVDFDRFGSSVAMFGGKVVVGSPYLSALVGDGFLVQRSGVAHQYDVLGSLPDVPIATFDDVGPGQGDNFGAAVQIEDTLMIVGAPNDDTGGENVGSAYLYDLASSMPTIPTVSLNNPEPDENDRFGTSVGISGSLVVVGVPESISEFNPGTRGKVYVYDLSGSTPSVPVTTIINPSPGVYSQFGAAVAISGTTVVVRPQTGSGVVFVYDLSGNTPALPASVISNPPMMPGADSFGHAVAIAGHRLLVTAPFDFSGQGGYLGRTYIYDLSSATPAMPVTTLINPNQTPPDHGGFGVAVAISGDRALVGEVFTVYDEGGIPLSSGRNVYAYELVGNSPAAPIAILQKPGPLQVDRFGASLAISGTLAVVGAPDHRSGALSVGSAYIYDLSSSTPSTPVATFINPTPGHLDFFGSAVSIYGRTVAIGAPSDDWLALDKGFTYVFGPSAADPDADDDGIPDTWELAYWPTTDGHGPLDDFDHDGIVELLELALGLSPTLPNPGGLPPVHNEGGYLTMTIAKQPGVNYEVQSGSSPTSLTASATTVLIDTATTLKVRDNIPVGSGQNRFMRAKVTAALR